MCLRIMKSRVTSKSIVVQTDGIRYLRLCLRVLHSVSDFELSVKNHVDPVPECMGLHGND